MLICDLSSNNSPPDFKSLKAHGVEGVWLKATEGRTYTDSRFLAWRDAASKAGLRVGAYHYARPDNGNTADAEAHHFCDIVRKIGRRDLRPVLDYEVERHGGQDENWIRAWNHWVRDSLGVGPLFYSYPYHIQQLKLSATVGYGLWLAAYGPDDGNYHPAPAVPAPWKKLVAQQYTSKGHVGTYGPVDLSLTFGLGCLAHPIIGRV